MIPGMVASPGLDEARVADLLLLAIRRARIRRLEDDEFGLAIDRSLMEPQNRVEPPKRVILNERPVSAEDVQGGLECAICLSEFEAGEGGVVALKCGHVFRTECLRPWFEAHRTCPACRAEIDEG
jgi:hypothetical protein